MTKQLATTHVCQSGQAFNIADASVEGFLLGNVLVLPALDTVTVSYTLVLIVIKQFVFDNQIVIFIV